MAKIKYTWKVLYQEIDADRRMRLFTLENHILTVAGKVADEYGYGQQYLFKQGLTWIITHCSIEMQELPQANDVIVFETWIESNAHMLSVRNFRIYKDTGYWDPGWEEMNEEEREARRILIGKAKTTWAVLDLTKREIVNVFNQPAFQDIVDGEVLDMPRPSRMVPFNTTTSDAQSTIHTQQSTILYSSVDYNNHCNSCKYPEFMLDMYKPEWLSQPFRFDIRYIHEMKLGEIIETTCQIEENQVIYQQKNKSGTLICSAQIVHL